MPTRTATWGSPCSAWCPPFPHLGVHVPRPRAGFRLSQFWLKRVRTTVPASFSMAVPTQERSLLVSQTTVLSPVQWTCDQCACTVVLARRRTPASGGSVGQACVAEWRSPRVRFVTVRTLPTIELPKRVGQSLLAI